MNEHTGSRQGTIGFDSIDLLPVPACVMGKSGNIVAVNQPWASLLGYPDRDTVLETPTQRLWADIKQRAARVEELRSHRELHDGEAHLIKYNGQSIWLLLQAHEVEFAEGTAWLVVGEDVTEQRRNSERALESEARFRALFEASPVALWEEDFSRVGIWFEELRAAGVTDLRAHLEADPEDLTRLVSMIRVRSVNRAGLALLNGSSGEQVLESGLSSLKGNVKALTEEVVALWEGDDHVTVEADIVAQDGIRMRGQIHVSVPRANGQPDLSRVIVAIVDLTPRGEVEQAREKAARLHHGFFMRTPLPMIRSTTAGELIAANPAALTLLGVDTVADVEPLEGADASKAEGAGAALLQTIVDRGHVTDGAVRAVRSDGSPLVIRAFATVREDPEGEMLEIALVDVTEERESVKALEASEARYRHLFEQSPIGLLLVDSRSLDEWIQRLEAEGVEDVAGYIADHRDELTDRLTEVEVLEANEAAGSLLGVEHPDALCGPLFETPIVGVFGPREAVRLFAARATETGEAEISAGIDRQVRRFAVRWLQPDEGSAIEGARLVLFADVTDRYRAAEALERLVESKDELLAAVSHELRTPLTGIVGFSEELRSGWAGLPEDDKLEFVNFIADESVKATKIVQDLLVTTRVETVDEALRVAPLNLPSEVRAAMGELEGTSGVATDLRDVWALADPQRLRQIISHLVSNAILHGGPRVSVQTREFGGGAEVRVRDNGLGIPKDQVDRAFARYETRARLSSSSARLGIGLPLSRKLAALMGGDVTYRRIDGWTEFVLELPAADVGEPRGVVEGLARHRRPAAPSRVRGSSDATTARGR